MAFKLPKLGNSTKLPKPKPMTKVAPKPPVAPTPNVNPADINVPPLPKGSLLSRAGNLGKKALPTLAIGGIMGGIGFLPSLISSASNVATVSVIANEIGEVVNSTVDKLTDNPLNLAIVAGVIGFFVFMR